MSGLTDAFGEGASGGAPRTRQSIQEAHRHTSGLPGVTILLSKADHARLVELADGMALCTYIRALALSDDLSKRKRRSLSPVSDDKDFAQVLGLLGQSRIANNLNQLAYQANIGALQMDDEALTQIEEAYAYVVAIRGLLLKALCMRS